MMRRFGRAQRSLVVVSSALSLTGCLVGPDYRRPETSPPPQYRFASEAVEQASLGDLKWFELFQDDALRDLIQTALAQNYDLEIAAARVLQAKAQVGIVRSQIFPQITGAGSGQTTRIAQNASTGLPPGVNPVVTYGTLSLGLTWEIDVWGRIRRLTESARAEFLSSQDAQRAVLITVIADVATAYFQLRALDLQLEISRRTIEARERGLRLTRTQRDLGTGTGLDVAQAEDLLYTARATIRDIERQIGQTEDLLSLLLGRNPGEIIRGRSLNAVMQNLPSVIPAGLPSSLLERRPDVRAAEQNLVAANATIGAAKALYFPQISLTGLLGLQSDTFKEFFKKTSWVYNLGSTAVVPIFTAGRISSQVDQARGQTQEAFAAYEKTVRVALTEVSDSLIDFTKRREQRVEQEALVAARDRSVRLSQLRYRGGLDSYLQVLDAETRLFAGQLELADLKRDELTAIVRLYRALGGGWEGVMAAN